MLNNKTLIDMETLFVAFSHNLTPDQKEGWDNIVTLKDVNPELQAQISQIPANATLQDIIDLAIAIVQEAFNSGATHFFCVGEPTLTMWANLIASSNVSHELFGKLDVAQSNFLIPVQSTTERISVEITQTDGSVTKTAVFKHVQWRKMF